MGSRESTALSITKPFGVSVIVPVYNSAEVLPTTIPRLTEYLATEFSHYELILIDDGSVDESPVLLRTAAANNKNIRFFIHEFNMGQQRAIAEGILSAQEDIVIVVDADLPCGLADLKNIADIAHDGIELVLTKRSGQLRRSWWRTLGSRIVNTLFRILYAYQIEDFGCGVGAMRRPLIEKLRRQERPVRLIKLDLLHLVENYLEVEIQIPEAETYTKSGYSPGKLIKLFWLMLIYQFSLGISNNRD